MTHELSTLQFVLLFVFLALGVCALFVGRPGLTAIMLLGVFGALLTGCNSMANWQRAMANDQSTMTGQVTSVYGTAKFVRIGPVGAGQTVSASPDGTVTVKGVPLSQASSESTTSIPSNPSKKAR